MSDSKHRFFKVEESSLREVDGINFESDGGIIVVGDVVEIEGKSVVNQVCAIHIDKRFRDWTMLTVVEKDE